VPWKEKPVFLQNKIKSAENLKVYNAVYRKALTLSFQDKPAIWVFIHILDHRADKN